MESTQRNRIYHLFYRYTYIRPIVKISLIVLLVALVVIYSVSYFFEKEYAGRIYPAVTVGRIPFGGKTPQEVEQFWLEKNTPFLSKQFTFQFENLSATVSAVDLNLGYDATLSGQQAYLIGRSGYFFSDTLKKLSRDPIDLTPLFRWNEDILDTAVDRLSQQIDIPVQESLFQFSGGKVTSFRPSKVGRQVNRGETKKRFASLLDQIPGMTTDMVTISARIDPVNPSIETAQTNTFGIKELIGRGYSEFAHSIPGRIHNVILTAAKINGILIKPGETFSFNDAVGDISAATGFQPAYIIKDGRTVLGDGGGVCQVSTTLFRAALAAGLPIIKRQAHAYRVAYYEQAGYKAGLDATVFAPSVDLVIKNDTSGYILIQSKPNKANLTLSIELYGTSDGRKSEILNHQVGSITPPPPDLYQDDPTLPAGIVKQVDFAAWGAKASFQYKVTRGSEVLQDTSFISNFRPWQAVYLRGTKQ